MADEPDADDLDATWGMPNSPAVQQATVDDPTTQRGRRAPKDRPAPPGRQRRRTPMRYPRPSYALHALILSILSLVLCGLTAPLGLIVGVLDMRAMKQGRTDPSRRGTARAAVVLAIVALSFVTIIVGFVVLATLVSTAA